MRDTSKMPARIWANDGANSQSYLSAPNRNHRAPYIRADIVEAMAEALKEARDALNGAPNTVGLHCQIDTAIAAYREATNDHVA